MTMYNAITKNVSQILKDAIFEILEVSKTEKVDTETGEKKRFLKFSVEVLRDIRPFARCRFTVKVLDSSGEVPVTEEDLDKKAYFVKFRDLKISFISSSKEVYFGAESFYICNTEADVETDSY